MTDQHITDYSLTKECNSLAADIFSETIADMASDETPEDYRDDMTDRVHETVDGHQWLIYYHYAHEICLNCDTTNGEEFLEDVGLPPQPTYDNLGMSIAYGEMRARVEAELQRLIDDWEDTREEEAA